MTDTTQSLLEEATIIARRLSAKVSPGDAALIMDGRCDNMLGLSLRREAALAALQSREELIGEMREALQFYGENWEQDVDAERVGPNDWQGSIGEIHPTDELRDDHGKLARTILDRLTTKEGDGE